MSLGIFQRIRHYISHRYHVNSGIGTVFLNIAAVCVIGIILSINANVIVVYANDGKMPVVVENVYAYNITDRHTVADSATNLLFLGDTITIDQETVSFESPFIEFLARMINFPFGRNVIASPGDVGMWIFLSIGLLMSLFLLTYVSWLCINRWVRKL